MWKIGKGHEYGAKTAGGLALPFVNHEEIHELKKREREKKIQQHGELPIVHLLRASNSLLCFCFNASPFLSSHPLVHFFYLKSAVSTTFSGLEETAVHPKTPAFHLQVFKATWDLCVCVYQ